MKKNDIINIQLSAIEALVVFATIGSTSTQKKRELFHSTSAYPPAVTESDVTACSTAYIKFEDQLADAFGINPKLLVKWDQNTICTREQALKWAEKHRDAIVRYNKGTAQARDWFFTGDIGDFNVLIGTDGLTPVWKPLTEIEIDDEL